MAYSFGDSFDLYAVQADLIAGYWDSVVSTSFSFQTGRFSGGRGLSVGIGSGLIKNSGQNDAVHHVVVSFEQLNQAIGGATPGFYFTLYDGATAQCSVVFRIDGAILLQSGAPGGTVLATYTGAFTAQNVWYGFEFEIVINNTAGSFTVRRNGNIVNDFAATALNTRPVSTNNYANRLQIGAQGGGTNNHVIDDLFWRSDASAVAWMGDLRCYARMPATDVAVQFAKSASSMLLTVGNYWSTFNTGTGTAYYSVFAPQYSGTIAAATFNIQNNITGHVKAAIYDNSGPGGGPGVVLGTATIVTNPVGPPPVTNALTFSPAVPVVKGQLYYLGLTADVTITYGIAVGFAGGNFYSYNGPVTYAAFPGTNPAGLSLIQSPLFTTFTITAARNADFVGEAQQDQLTTYVSDNVSGHTDLYGVATIPGAPLSTLAVVTRGFGQKSDAGTRIAAMQLKSGGTTVQSPTSGSISSGVWNWLWRTDLVDPSTGAAWTAAAVNAAQIGPVIIT